MTYGVEDDEADALLEALVDMLLFELPVMVLTLVW